MDPRGARDHEPGDLVAGFAAYHAEVRQRLAEGWGLVIDDVEVEPQAEPTYVTYPALENAVLATPVDEAAWAALGDAWAQAGDPRGESILLSRGANQTDPAEFMRRKAALLPMVRRRTGLCYGRFGDDAYRVSAKFIGGLIDVAELEAEAQAPGQPTCTLLELLLTSPFARFLSALSFGAHLVTSSLEVIAAIGAPALRTLTVRQLVERSSEPVPLGPASTGLLRLRRLVLRLEHARIDWTDASLPSLTHLELDEPGSPAACDELLAWLASQPAIERVVIAPGLLGRDANQIHQRLHAWMTGPTPWPPSLREVSWNHQIARR